MATPVRILDFDASVVQQREFMARFTPRVIECRDIGPSVRMWMGERSADEIRRRLSPESKRDITFIGSGDFHHVSGLLLEQFHEPTNLIVFDFHPDWDILPPRRGCGSWVRTARTRASISKIVLLGVSSRDIDTPSLHTADLDCLSNDRCEIYPYAHPASRVYVRRVPQNISVQAKRGFMRTEIIWNHIAGRDLKSFFYDLIRRFKTKDTYVSIDKDCLQPAWALTNWEHGLMSLDQLILLLRLIKDNLKIVGSDITGDYSYPVVSGKIRQAVSRIDHPRNFSACGITDDHIVSINEKTNIALADLLTG